MKHKTNAINLIAGHACKIVAPIRPKMKKTTIKRCSLVTKNQFRRKRRLISISKYEYRIYRYSRHRDVRRLNWINIFFHFASKLHIVRHLSKWNQNISFRFLYFSICQRKKMSVRRKLLFEIDFNQSRSCQLSIRHADQLRLNKYVSSIRQCHRLHMDEYSRRNFYWVFQINMHFVRRSFQ